jgi:predicted RNase H-like HicB family nuclease
MVTCDELPGVAHCGGDEDEVLALTQIIIEEALRSRPAPRG